MKSYFLTDLIAFSKSWLHNKYLCISVHDKLEFKRIYNSAEINSVDIRFLLSLNKCFICENTDSTKELLAGNEYKKHISFLKFGA